MTNPTPDARPRAVSLLLWISGGVLWLIVGVLGYATWFRGDASPSTGETPSDPPAVFVEVQNDDGEAVAAGGLVDSVGMWSEDGIGDFSLTERSGKTVTKQDLLGKPWVVGFIFTRCAGPCPRVSGQMARLQKQLEDEDVRLVTMTVEPEYDTPEVLTRYATAFGADEEKWLFLTGDKETMYRYIEEHFRMPVEETQGEERKPGYEVIHTTNLLLVDAEGVVRGKYNALNAEEMAKLRSDLKNLPQ